MAIVNSVFALESVQVDGRRYVRETHTDNLGLQYVINYLAAVGANYSAIMTARAAVIALQIADQEYADNLERSTPLFNYQTKTEFAARFRAAYKAANKEQLARLAYWIIERINDGTFTDAQVQNAFGLTNPQYTAMKARAQTLHDDWSVILAAVGE